HRRHWHVHTDSDLGHCANFGDPTRRGALKQEWREAREEKPSVLARHLLSRQMEIETLLVDEAAAQAEGGRRLGLYGVHREALTIGIDIADADDLQPGMTVEVVVDRY